MLQKLPKFQVKQAKASKICWKRYRPPHRAPAGLCHRCARTATAPHRGAERHAAPRPGPAPGCATRAAVVGCGACPRPAGELREGPAGSTPTRSIFSCAVRVCTTRVGITMCSVHTTCVCTTRVSTTRVCAPCEHHPCVPHLCVHTIRVCTIPVRTTRLPNTAHTPQAHTAVLHTSVPRRHGEAESPTASPSSPAAPLPTRRRHGALHIHRPRGDHRRPSPHPSVATGAARSGSGCAVCVAAPVAPADGGAGRTAASPPRSPAVPPPPPPVAVTAGWSGAAAPVLSPAGFRAATSETATKNTARPAVTSKPSGPGNESRSRAAPSRDRTSPRGRGNGAAAPRLSSTHPIARGVPAVPGL